MVSQLVAWFTTFFVVRLLTPQDFGLFSMAISYYAILETFHDFCLGHALLQKKDLTDDDLNGCFWLVMILSCFFYCISYYLAGPIAHFYNSDELIFLIRLMCVGILFQGVMIVPYWVLTKKLDFEKRAKSTLFSGLISSVLCLVVAVMGYGIWALVIRFMCRHFLLTFFIYVFYPWVPKFQFNFKRMIPLVKYGLNVTGERAFDLVSRKVDIIIIGKVLGKELLGYYSVAVQLSRMPLNKVVSIVNQISFPVFSELQDNPEALSKYFLKITHLIGFFSFPVLLGAVFTAKELIVLFLGVKWLPMVTIFQILCAVALFQTLFGIVSALNKAVNKPHLNFRFNLCLSILVAIFIFIGVQFGLIHAVMAWLIVYPILFFITVRLSIKKINLSLAAYIYNLTYPFVSAVVMVALLFVFQSLVVLESNFIVLLVNIPLGVFIYALCMYVFSADTIKDCFALVKELKQK
ncbi:MAG: lipopolysaccharide biosynthesis protein [Desulfobacula sp.]|nr:lipopolysaccharide biosynthesis protein [Desulfobacula sp.]